jgi:hypothetical protein
VENLGTSIAVIYEEGVFKPQEPVPASVKPHQVLHLPLPDGDAEETPAVNEGDDDATGWTTAMELIGCLKGGSADVARNHDKYLYDKA